MPPVIQYGKDVESIIKSLPLLEELHMQRVGVFVGILTKAVEDMGLYPQFSGDFEYFGEAASYHDLGKAFIPREILTKSERLNKEEEKEVHMHPLFSRDIFFWISEGNIKGIPKYIYQYAYDSAVYHHERWDGKGYPFGLTETKIPLIARITSVCDAYDAITSDRYYRTALSHSCACNEIKRRSGTQFDPELSRIFLENDELFRMELAV